MRDRGWHLIKVGDKGPQLSYNDGRFVGVGETIRVGGTPECVHGLHYCRSALV